MFNRIFKSFKPIIFRTTKLSVGYILYNSNGILHPIPPNYISPGINSNNYKESYLKVKESQKINVKDTKLYYINFIKHLVKSYDVRDQIRLGRTIFYIKIAEKSIFNNSLLPSKLSEIVISQLKSLY